MIQPVPIHIDDDGFVRAPASLVYRRLAEVTAWPTWWPGVRVNARSPGPPPPAPAAVAPDEVVALELAGSPGRRVRLTARLHGWRTDVGFALALRGDLEGRAEFWLEPGWGGTVVHHLVAATTTHARPVHVLSDHRWAVRRGLWALKDLLELEVRTGAGLSP